jgi:hypothetical protein
MRDVSALALKEKGHGWIEDQSPKTRRAGQLAGNRCWQPNVRPKRDCAVSYTRRGGWLIERFYKPVEEGRAFAENPTVRPVELGNLG